MTYSDADAALRLILSEPQTLFTTGCSHPGALPFSVCFLFLIYRTPQWGAADAEIKVPSGENTEFKRSAFKAASRSVYSQTCYAYCEGFLP